MQAMGSIHDYDDVPQLSAHALSALEEFLGERDQRAKQFEDLKTAAEDEFGKSSQPLTMEAFTEDWNATVVSAPSVFIQLKNLLRSGEYKARPEVKLLEFDERFGVFKEYVPYDFVYPTRLPPDLKGQFDRIICDPPFISVDCQTKADIAALTVRWLAKSWDSCAQRLIICTGERMESMICKLYGKAGVRTTDFEIQHSNCLNNEFRCYANYEARDIWKWNDDSE
ncbi:N-6 adenine-specific DNA methyltransferase 2 [Lasiodiplodia theobromae]|uniref:N-6 adenine-specific DNA methyltransferase 2 n=1 Tax=Lasiodiplodia theobromae TaxID=45133 RepID=UPI0015C39697|nr:N-6 adenine-specific DNA methyltransferase 2 [Lasiodiplodia theobromae]KAF4537601.1 N-6 adenine-specific DNA methyltransferase 2 [Lasiodiplodia theobromae]